MLFLYMLASAVAGVMIASAAGRFAWLAGLVLLLIGLAPTAALFAYDALAGFDGDPSAYSMGATLASIIIAPSGIAALATALVRA